MKELGSSYANISTMNGGSTNNNDGCLLQFGIVTLDEAYCKKWNINSQDFVCLVKNGELLRNTLYRIGGLNNPKLNKDKYFMLLKQVESFYDKEILKLSGSKDPKHLEGKWCILDKEGNEKIVFENKLNYPRLVENSCIYSIGGNYYNIETGEFYCNASEVIESTDYLFLENRYDKDKTKRGIMKINKKDGSWELFS